MQPATGNNRPCADQTTYLSDLCRELERPWPGNRTITIACHGHSVPAGYFKTPVVESFNAYPHLVHRLIKQRFPYAVVNVIVTAIGGEHSTSGGRRFKCDVLSLRPDVVTIDYALNDRRIELDQARQNWHRMIEEAKQGQIKVILLTPTPDTAANLQDPADPLNRHADQVRSLAAEHGVGLADSLAAFERVIVRGTPLDELMSVPNHPNRRGHDLVADELIRWWQA